MSTGWHDLQQFQFGMRERKREPLNSRNLRWNCSSVAASRADVIICENIKNAVDKAEDRGYTNKSKPCVYQCKLKV